MKPIDKICDNNICTGCGACMQKCPKSAIIMKVDKEGFLCPAIDSEKCIGCGLCVGVCPQNKKIESHEGTFFMGWHTDKDVLAGSSSGGAFTVLTDFVLKRNGVVFGVVQDPKTNDLYHDFAISNDQVAPMKLSKYYQSETRNSFSAVKKFLDGNLWVLFSGTACQVAGLYSYLGKDYDNLITVDVLCHGVPSKTVVDSWVKSKEKRFKMKIKAFTFRVKDDQRGWQSGAGTRMRMEFEDGSVYVEDGAEDTYMIGFNKNLFLRECCYRCKYCGTQRVADVTIGDFWGCNREDVSKEQMKLGVSLLLLNTPKAYKVFGQAKGIFELTEIKSEEAIPYNRALVQPNTRPDLRNWFYRIIKVVSYDTAVQCIFARRFLKRKVKKLLGMM